MHLSQSHYRDISISRINERWLVHSSRMISSSFHSKFAGSRSSTFVICEMGKPLGNYPRSPMKRAFVREGTALENLKTSRSRIQLKLFINFMSSIQHDCKNAYQRPIPHERNSSKRIVWSRTPII